MNPEEALSEAPPDGAAAPSGGRRIRIQADRASVEGWDGEALLAALRRAGVPVQSVCGGKGACGTCRIHVPPEWRGRAGEPSKREARLLGHLKADEGDRLSCQIRLGDGLDGLELRTYINHTEGDAQ